MWLRETDERPSFLVRRPKATMICLSSDSLRYVVVLSERAQAHLESSAWRAPRSHPQGASEYRAPLIVADCSRHASKACLDFTGRTRGSRRTPLRATRGSVETPSRHGNPGGERARWRLLRDREEAWNATRAATRANDQVQRRAAFRPGLCHRRRPRKTVRATSLEE